MKIYQRFFRILLVLLCLGSTTVSALTLSRERIVLGADLSEEERQQVYELMEIKEGSIRETEISLREVRSIFADLTELSLDDASLFCIYMKALSDGSSSTVDRINIELCTEEMYLSALETAGIRDVKVTVAAAKPVPGIAAFAGICRAYEELTGEELAEEAKLAGAEVLCVTGTLSDELGSFDASLIVKKLLEYTNYTEGMSDEELRKSILALSEEYRVHLNEYQLTQLMELCRKLEKLDEGRLSEAVEDIRQAKEKLDNAKEKAEEAKEKAEEVMEKAEEKTEQAKGKWAQIREKLRIFGKKADEYGEKAKEDLEKAGEKAREDLEKAQEKAKEYEQQAREGLEEAEENSESSWNRLRAFGVKFVGFFRDLFGEEDAE